MNRHKFQYETAQTEAEREKGLSGRRILPADHAMLFVFDEAGQYCFWMKDMRFSLDMIWLNDAKKVISIKENATPSSYPASFCPNQSARYVIEVNRGVAQADSIKVGDQVSF